MTQQYIDPLSLEKLEEHQQREYFKLDKDWVEAMRIHNPAGYKQMVANWVAHEEEAKYCRYLDSDVIGDKLTNSEGWSRNPEMVVPDLLVQQMEKRFGPAWASFNFLRYGIWLFYPKLRCNAKWHGKKKGINRKHIGKDFNTKQEIT